MGKIYCNREIAKLILLQRIELASPFLKKIRKLLGRYFFSNFASKYFIKPNVVVAQYLKLMEIECDSIQNFIDFSNKKILSIGGGMGGLELAINKKYQNTSFDLIEKNYVSKKVRYGWDYQNNEAYNNLSLLRSFLENNGIKKELFNIYNSETKNFPVKKFDVILSLFSLDYHYDFSIYHNYLKKVSDNNTFMIFDTIRPGYFNDIFKKVQVIHSHQTTIHKSKRIICNEFINH